MQKTHLTSILYMSVLGKCLQRSMLEMSSKTMRWNWPVKLFNDPQATNFQKNIN